MNYKPLIRACVLLLTLHFAIPKLAALEAVYSQDLAKDRVFVVYHRQSGYDPAATQVKSSDAEPLDAAPQFAYEALSNHMYLGVISNRLDGSATAVWTNTVYAAGRSTEPMFRVIKMLETEDHLLICYSERHQVFGEVIPVSPEAPEFHRRRSLLVFEMQPGAITNAIFTHHVGVLPALSLTSKKGMALKWWVTNRVFEADSSNSAELQSTPHTTNLFRILGNGQLTQHFELISGRWRQLK